MSNAELVLNSDKAVLAKYILSIDNPCVLAEVKRRLSGLIHIEITTPSNSRTENLLDAIAGKWDDDRSADEMVEHIYSARKNTTIEEYTNPFEL